MGGILIEFQTKGCQEIFTKLRVDTCYSGTAKAHALSSTTRYHRPGTSVGLEPITNLQEPNMEIHEKESQYLPQVLLLKPPPDFELFGEEAFPSEKFQFLKVWKSTLPLDQFLKTHAQSVEAILSSGGAPVTAEILLLMPAVRLVMTTSAGLNHIDIAECRRRGISIANAGNVFSEDVADLAVGLLIDVLRTVSAADGYVRRGLWTAKGDYPLGSKLGGKRVGIVGLGSIGSLVAERLVTFGCHISYNSRTQKPSVPYPFYSSVQELAANSDVLIICCGLTEETRHMINKDVLSALGKEGVIVNIGRGAIIDEQELVRCLVQGEIKGAGLDVFENEPDVPKELFAMNNVVLSPHRAVFTSETFQDRQKLVVANLEAFFSNKPLLTPVVDD
ncbi:glyoxylate/hydroxypyruvate reductase HPR3-like [Mangifera indica]|uniref:glyoxylate/hydroxypyruvate reductase HPR3-like n=1 Tax=Mangifera indica TaxID=29780 RepID=UPI001CF9355D|nr:glyoxylate/hydroxypyruvate reductase HPR3-like [Mangifera indica]